MSICNLVTNLYILRVRFEFGRIVSEALLGQQGCVDGRGNLLCEHFMLRAALVIRCQM